MKVELLYFDDCPSYETAYNTLGEVLKEEGIEAEIEKVNVKTEEEAQKLRFLGSPTIRVDGKDVERKARKSTAYGRRRCYARPSRPRSRWTFRCSVVPHLSKGREALE
ncbi:hypothetical protein IPdc08_00433 [archaeon]|nr:hypothetical protein IPdc08_00433 [archaeon]